MLLNFVSALCVPLVIVWVGFASSASLVAQSTPMFIQGDARSESQGISGYVITDSDTDDSTIHVVASELISTIERSTHAGCVCHFQVTSALSGEELVLTIHADGTAVFSQDGSIVATISAGGCNGLVYSGSTDLPNSLAFKALLAAALDTNLDLIKPCEGTVEFEIDIDGNFQRDSRTWSVESAVLRVTAARQTIVTFCAQSNEEIENWRIEINTGSAVVETATVNGEFRYGFRRVNGAIDITTSVGTATTTNTDSMPPVAMQVLLEEVRSCITFAHDVMDATTIADVFTVEEVEERCRLGCNDSLPYGSNCQTVTEKYGCCLTDVQRATCRRMCMCYYYENTWWSYWCAAQAAILADIDLAGCVAAFLKSWD